MAFSPFFTTKMGYFSCNSETSIIACDPYNKNGINGTQKNSKSKSKRKKHITRIRRFSYAELEAATDSFSVTSFLGKGSHGSVYRAVIDSGRVTVAVKKFQSSASHHHQNSCIDDEIEILSKIRNPNFVNLLGFCNEDNKKKLIVVEYMENGSLYELLHKNTRPPGWTKRVRFGLQVAKAVSALHSFNPPVIHRDIKSSNVLIDGEWNARLGDFGLSLRGHVEDVRIKCTPPAGTLGYLDPCYIAPENLSSKSDVFSFGILLLEILSGRNAIDVNFSPPSVLDWALPLIKHGEFVAICDPRIDLPEDLLVVEELALLAMRCVRAKLEKRPAMMEVVECLRVVYKRVSSPIWNNFKRRLRMPTLGIEAKNVEFGSRIGGGGRVQRRSNSIGSSSEIRQRNESHFSRRKPGVVVRMPVTKLSKSRSLGVLRSRSFMPDNERDLMFHLVKNSRVEGLDMSKLVISVDQGFKK